jgi:hypothetical protein
VPDDLLAYVLGTMGLSVLYLPARWLVRRAYAWLKAANYVFYLERNDAAKLRLERHAFELEASAERAQRKEAYEWRDCAERRAAAAEERAERAEEQRDRLARQIAGLEE